MATVYAGEIITRFGADLSGLASGIKQAQSMGASYSSQMTRQADTASRGFGGMTKSVLAAGAGIGGWVFAAKEAVGAAIGLGEALLGPNAAMEQTQIAFKGLLGSGDAATAMMKTLQDFAAKTPFEFPALAEDARMLIGMGLAAKDVVPWMTAIGDAAAGVGAGTEGVQRVTMALGQMQAKGKISGEEMMQLTEAGIPAWRILAQSMGLSVAQVQDLSQQGKLGSDAIGSLVKGMEGMYGGQMANQAKTFNGLLSNLKDDIGMALRAFTGPLFEAAKGALTTLVGFLEGPAFKSFATGAAKWIADAFARIGQFIGPVIAGIGQFISSLQGGNGPSSQFMQTLQQLAGVIMGNFMDEAEQISGFVMTSLIPAFQALSPTFQRIGDLFTTVLIPAFNRVLPIVMEVASMVRNIFLVALSAALPVIVNIANFLSSLLVPAIKFIAPYFMQAASTVAAFAREIGPQLIPLIQQVGALIVSMVTTVRAIWIAVWPTLGPILKGVFDIIVGVVKIAWSLISGIFRVALDLLSGNWGKAWTDMKNMFGGIMDGIGTIARGAWTILTGIFTAGKNAIGSIFSALGSLVYTLWSTIFNTITGFANNIFNSVIGKFNALRDTVGGIFRSAMNYIIGQLNNGLNSISSFINFFVDAINKVSSFFGAGNVLGRVSLGPISYLAQGTKDFAGGVAMVGERGREFAAFPTGEVALLGQRGQEMTILPRGTSVLPNKETEELIRRGVYPVPHLAGGAGDFLGNIFSWITGGISSITDNLLSQVLNGAPGMIGGLGNIGGGILSKVAGWLAEWVKNAFTSPAFTGNLPMAQRGQFILPPGGGYGEQYWYGRHQGMDFQFPQGTPVHEVVGGAVMPSTGWYPWGGEVDVRLFNGLVERYLHLSAIFTRINQGLMRGETIGLSGGGTPESGLGYWSTGSHLHIQYDTGDYQSSFDPLSVWASLGIYKPFKKGGLINEKILGIGASSGKGYSFGERGMESVTPASAQERMAQALERIERLLTNDGRLTEYQVQQALGRLLASGVR